MRRFLAAAVATVGVLSVLVGPSIAMASPTATPSIVNGHTASIAEFPSLAFIEFAEPTGVYGCTGSVVAPRVILTAGHCVENIESGSIVQAHDYAVATGVSNILKAGKANVSTVSQVLVNPSFDIKRTTGDAGLLILSAPVTAPVLPLAGPADAGLLAGGTPMTMAGWGVTSGRSLTETTTLRAADTTVQAPEYCQRQTSGYYHSYTPESQLCAVDMSSHHAGGCYGDSGGPAIAHRADGTPVEIGVASTVKPGCITAFPTVYTRADLINPWVTSWINAVEHGGPAPAISIPQAHLPPLSEERAEELADVIFESDFKSRFREDTSLIFCSRVSKAKQRCSAGWTQGGSEYYGKITVSYVLQENVLLFDGHYTIHAVRESCLRHSPHPRTCPVKTRHR
jgi:secreted trypsin-like serine protease